MLKVGLTGGLACGKSFVGEALAGLRLPADPGRRAGPRRCWRRAARPTTTWCGNSAAEILAADGRHRPARAGGAGVRRRRSGWRASTPGASAGGPARGRADRRVRRARAARHRGGGSRHSDRDRQLQALRPDDPGDLPRRAAGGARHAARGRVGGRCPGAPQPPDAAGGETKIRRFRHRYIREKKKIRCGRPGPSTKHYGESNHESSATICSGPPCWWPVFCTSPRWRTGMWARSCGRSAIGSRLWTEPASAATAGGFTADEQNNIDIYQSGPRRHGEYHVDRVYREDWFFGVYPGKGTGSGFIINPGRRDPDELITWCSGDRPVDRHAVR